jgi:hypothetical protein
MTTLPVTKFTTRTLRTKTTIKLLFNSPKPDGTVAAILREKDIANFWHNLSGAYNDAFNGK